MTGTLAILSVGVGDTKLTFDPKKPAEVRKAAKIVKDMLRKGFVLLVEVGKNEKGPIYQRALDFDENTAEYIIAGEAHEPEQTAAPSRSRAGKKARGSTSARVRYPAVSTNAVSVARTAGG